MNILVFGAGAIGTYIGGSLLWKGHRVTFLERPQAAKTLAERGIYLDLTLLRHGILTFPPSSFQVSTALQEALERSTYDLAIFALKSFDTPAAVETLRPLATALPPLLCLSNGVENEAMLAEVLGEKVVPGTVTSAVLRLDVGKVKLEKRRGIGLASAHPATQEWLQAFNEAALRPRLYSDAASMKWSKLLTNLVANATSAILDMSPAEIFADPRLYRLEMEQLREAIAVMKAQGLKVIDLPGTPVRWLARIAQSPTFLRPIVRPFLAKGRGEKMPSLHIDLYAGRRQSEVTYLNGAVVRFGERHGIPTPLNRLLNDLLLDLVQGKIPLANFARQPQKLLPLLSGKYPKN
ncbi:MAG: ketopantoate reductase family protein [Anaerolineales bacterium]